MKNQGFFCVVYFILESEQRTDRKGNMKRVITKGSTVYYRKVWNPSKLANYFYSQKKEWLWIKIYTDKQDYFSCPKANNYYAIFDENNPVRSFNFSPFKKQVS